MFLLNTLFLFHFSFEEWEEHLENWKTKLQKAVENAQNASKPKYNSGLLTPKEKNLLKNKIKNFKRDKVYQKCPQKPSDPNFTMDSNYMDVLKLINAWKCAVLSQIAREELSLCYIKDRDIQEVTSSQLYKTYQNGRAKGLIKEKIEIKRDCAT